jgi:hypothetical protein
MEMGTNWYGFYCGFATHKRWLAFDMGHSGSFDQYSSLHSGEDYLHKGMISRAIYLPDCVFAWGT